MFAASTCPYSRVGRHALDHIAKPDVLVDDKARQAHLVRKPFALTSGCPGVASTRHQALRAVPTLDRIP